MRKQVKELINNFYVKEDEFSERDLLNPVEVFYNDLIKYEIATEDELVSILKDWNYLSGKDDEDVREALRDNSSGITLEVLKEILYLYTKYETFEDLRKLSTEMRKKMEKIDYRQDGKKFFKKNRVILIDEDEGNIKKYYQHPIHKNVYSSTEGEILDIWRWFNPRTQEKYHREIKQSVQANGYVNVIFNDDEGKSINKLVHRLVLETFVPQPDEENDWVVDHIDNDKENNRLENLQWLTREDNLKKRDEDGSPLNKSLWVYDRDLNKFTKYNSRLEACEVMNVKPSNLTNAILTGLGLNKSRYYAANTKEELEAVINNISGGNN